MTDVDANRLREVLSYDERTGVFRWNFCLKTGPRRTGKIAGTSVTGGYISIGIDGKYYKAHRLAWLYVHGKWPRGLVDHIDLDTSNNSISNLRDVSDNENQWNSISVRNKTGYRGVAQIPYGFFAAAMRDGKRYYLGSFRTAKAASEAYESFRKKYDGEFYPCVNRVPVASHTEDVEHERAGA